MLLSLVQASETGKKPLKNSQHTKTPKPTGRLMMATQTWQGSTRVHRLRRQQPLVLYVVHTASFLGPPVRHPLWPVRKEHVWNNFRVWKYTSDHSETTKPKEVDYAAFCYNSCARAVWAGTRQPRGDGKSTSKTALFEHSAKVKLCWASHLPLLLLESSNTSNISLQKKTQTVSGMQAAVDCMDWTLDDSAESIDSIEMTHSRRFAGKAVDHYRAEFFRVLDSVEVWFGDHFDQESLKVLQKLECAPHWGVGWFIRSVPWAEQSFSVQLPLFRNKYPCSTSGEVVEVPRRLPVEVGGSFDQVEVLVRFQCGHVKLRGVCRNTFGSFV